MKLLILVMVLRWNILTSCSLWILLTFCSICSGKLWSKHADQASVSHLLEQRTKSLYDDRNQLDVSSPDFANSVWSDIVKPTSAGDFFTTTTLPLTTSVDSYFSVKMHPRKPQQTDIRTLEPKITFVYTEPTTTSKPLSADLEPRFIEQVFRQTIPKSPLSVPSRTEIPFPQQFFSHSQNQVNQWNPLTNPIIINLNDSRPFSPFGMRDQPVPNIPWIPRDSLDRPTSLPQTSQPGGFPQHLITNIPTQKHRTINPQNMQLGTSSLLDQQNQVNRFRPDSSFALISGPNSPTQGGPSGPIIAGNPPPSLTTPHIRPVHLTPMDSSMMTTRGGAQDWQKIDLDRQNTITSVKPDMSQHGTISQIAQNVARARQEGKTGEPGSASHMTRRRPFAIGGFRRRTPKPFYAAQRRRLASMTPTMSPFVASIQIESHPVTVQQDLLQSTIRLPPVWDGKVTNNNNNNNGQILINSIPQFGKFQQSQLVSQGAPPVGHQPPQLGQNKNVGIQLPPVWDGKTSSDNKQFSVQNHQVTAPMNNEQLMNSNNIAATPIPPNENNADMFPNPMSRQTTPFVCPCLQNPVGQNGAFVTPPSFSLPLQFPPQVQQPQMQPQRELGSGQGQTNFMQNQNSDFNQAMPSANSRQDFGISPSQNNFLQNRQPGNSQMMNFGLQQIPLLPNPSNGFATSNRNDITQNKLGNAFFVPKPPPPEDPYNPVGRATFEFLPVVHSVNANPANNFNIMNNVPGSNNEVRNFGNGQNMMNNNGQNMMNNNGQNMMNGNAVITGQGPYPGAESSIIAQSNTNKALQFLNNGPNVGMFAVGPGVTQQSQPTFPRPTMPSFGMETTTPSQWQPFTPHWSTTIEVEGPSQIVPLSRLKQLRQDIPETQVPKGPSPIWSYNLPDINKYQQGSVTKSTEIDRSDPQGTQPTITVDIIHPVRRLISVSSNTPICAQSQVNLDLDSSTPPNNILGTVLAADPGALSLQWTIQHDSSGGVFSVNKVTGEFGLIGSLKGINEALVEVRVGNSLGQFCITLVVIRVRRPFGEVGEDVQSRQMGLGGIANSGSWFSQDSFNVTIPCSLSGETLIMQATARHPAGQMVRYILRGTDEFGVNQTGYVALLRLNLGNPDTFRTFVIIALDVSGSESTATINMNLDLSTCYGPQFDVAAFIYDVHTDCSGIGPTDEIAQIMALPPSPQSRLSYSLIRTNQFMVDSMSGIISSMLPVEASQRLPDFGIVVSDAFGRKDTATVRISVFVNCTITQRPEIFNDAPTTSINASSNKWKSLNNEIHTNLGDFLMRVPCASPKGTVVASIDPTTLLGLNADVPNVRLENTAEFVVSLPNGTIIAQVDLPEVDTLFNFPIIADGSPFGLGRIVGNITVQIVCDSLSPSATAKKELMLGSTEQVSASSVQVSTFPFIPLDPWNTHLNLTFQDDTMVSS